MAKKFHAEGSATDRALCGNKGELVIVPLDEAKTAYCYENEDLCRVCAMHLVRRNPMMMTVTEEAAMEMTAAGTIRSEQDNAYFDVEVGGGLHQEALDVLFDSHMADLRQEEHDAYYDVEPIPSHVRNQTDGEEYTGHLPCGACGGKNHSVEQIKACYAKKNSGKVKETVKEEVSTRRRVRCGKCSPSMRQEHSKYHGSAAEVKACYMKKS